MSYKNKASSAAVTAGTNDESLVTPAALAGATIIGSSIYRPPTSGWSWVNQGSCTIYEGTSLVLQGPDNGGSSAQRARVRSPLTSTYKITIKAKFYGGHTTESLPSHGFYFQESGTGKLVYWKLFVADNDNYFPTDIIKYASPTSFTGYLLQSLVGLALPEWYRLKDTGTNLEFWVSNMVTPTDTDDGWILMGSYSYATCDFAGAPDKVGFGIDPHTLYSGTYSQNVINSWREH